MKGSKINRGYIYNHCLKTNAVTKYTLLSLIRELSSFDIYSDEVDNS